MKTAWRRRPDVWFVSHYRMKSDPIYCTIGGLESSHTLTFGGSAFELWSGPWPKSHILARIKLQRPELVVQCVSKNIPDIFTALHEMQISVISLVVFQLQLQLQLWFFSFSSSFSYYFISVTISVISFFSYSYSYSYFKPIQILRTHEKFCSITSLQWLISSICLRNIHIQVHEAPCNIIHRSMSISHWHSLQSLLSTHIGHSYS